MLKIAVTAVENRYGDLRYAREKKKNLFSKTTKERKQKQKQNQIMLKFKIKKSHLLNA